MKAEFISDLKERKSQPQFRTGMRRISTYLHVSAQSVFHHACSSLKNTVSETKISAFINVHPRFFYDWIFQIYDAVRHESTSINYMIFQGR